MRRPQSSLGGDGRQPRSSCSRRKSICRSIRSSKHVHSPWSGQAGLLHFPQQLTFHPTSPSRDASPLCSSKTNLRLLQTVHMPTEVMSPIRPRPYLVHLLADVPVSAPQTQVAQLEATIRSAHALLLTGLIDEATLLIAAFSTEVQPKITEVCWMILLTLLKSQDT